MHTQIRYRVECKDHYWYFKERTEAREFAVKWRETCSPVHLFKVYEIMNSTGQMVNRLEQPIRHYYETGSNGTLG